MDGTGASAIANINSTGSVVDITVINGGTNYSGIRKFVDKLPGVYVSGTSIIANVQNDLGQYIPVAVPDNTTYPAGGRPESPPVPDTIDMDRQF